MNAQTQQKKKYINQTEYVIPYAYSAARSSCESMTSTSYLQLTIQIAPQRFY